MLFNEDMALQLYQSRAIKFDSLGGWKLNVHHRYPNDHNIPRSPFYIDLRAPLRSVLSFRRRATHYMKIVVEEIGVSFDCMSDAPTAITPLVVALSDFISIPMISPRVNAKDHGLENEIDGFYRAGQSVIVIDDIFTTGGTLKDIIALYRRNGLVVSACFTVVDRSAEVHPSIDGVPFFAGFRWDNLLGFYRDRRMVTPELYDRCIRYPRDLAAYMHRYHPQE